MGLQAPITLSYIQPGKPQQNAYIERYNRTVRNEWLGINIFHSIQEVQEYATKWLWTYNNDRPNMGIGGVTRGFARFGLKRSTGSFLFRPAPPYETENSRVNSTAEPH